MASLRHEFYETDEKLTLTVFDKGADVTQVNVHFEPRGLVYENGPEKKLEFRPLKGQIDTEKSNFAVGKVKVEIRLFKVAQGRWGTLVGDSPDPLSTFPQASSSSSPPPPHVPTLPQARKNWDQLTNTILESAKKEDRTSNDDPNVGGDSTVNEFFQGIFANADEDTKRAMMKSYQESGGTALSTNWTEVGKGKVEVKPPSGSVAKKWEQ
ncbi:SGS-domain-containing protein [Stereum hirsutum FP-91666 SS1]|uniref:SGS-domain-containing protein n=1 Tax=Stereum hirsutum (strain FP-91666) TaxID=721885 RepID=UPI0004449B9B|nr:SGS-domain-containing protein [Stereum hirsutum FP-91666 SS1]EIM83525.1 SGS-domain-containing protein [Stereum hirsutum FP-91666 SS1]